MTARNLNAQKQKIVFFMPTNPIFSALKLSSAFTQADNSSCIIHELSRINAYPHKFTHLMP